MFIARPKNTLKLSVLRAVPKFTNQKAAVHFNPPVAKQKTPPQ